MERLKVKIAGASKALATLREVTGIDEVPAITRDAAIQRFEFTFEVIWKVAKMYLKEFKNLYLSQQFPFVVRRPENRTFWSLCFVNF